MPGKRNFIGFNKLEDLVLTDRVKAAVIIHENQIYLCLKGLVKVEDLRRFLGKVKPVCLFHSGAFLLQTAHQGTEFKTGKPDQAKVFVLPTAIRISS